MKFFKAFFLFLVLQKLASSAFGQTLVYNHYFINSYLYNPSYLAKDGHTELYLNFRKGWSGFDGAPKTATLNLQVPLNYKTAVGINIFNDQAGVLHTNTGLISFSYQIYLGQSISTVHKIGFGISAGFSNSGINLSKINNPDVPASTKSSTSGIDGQFGLNYQFKNLIFGFALPRILKSKLVSENNFNSPGLDPLQNTITSLSYNFILNQRISIEPFVLYRTEENGPSQIELLGVLKIDDVAWVGGAFRQDYGTAAFLGFKIKEKIKLGYAYEFAPHQVTSLGGGTHEIQLIVRLSKRKKERPRTTIKKSITEKTQTEETEKEVEIVEEPIAEKPKKEKAEPVHKIESETINTPVPIQLPEQTKSEVKNPTKNLQERKKEVAKSLDGNELPQGHYVVVGAFESVLHAKNYAVTLKKSGYPADIAFNPENQYYIVHMGVTPSMEEAKELRNVYRQKSRYSFRDTWILTVE